YFLTGLFNICIPVLVLSFVASKVPSGILSLGLMLIPLMIYALALALGMDQFRAVRLVGILAGLAGVLFRSQSAIRNFKPRPDAHSLDDLRPCAGARHGPVSRGSASRYLGRPSWCSFPISKCHPEF